jgi:alkylation response protein AidB-like acyl-CoA dehydrogenase
MERAPAYDRDNSFFTEDFNELKASGYLNAAVPKELGGLGLTLEEIAKEQRRLAYHSAATALGVNMHFYWTGLAADVWRSGDKSTEWILTESVAGKIFAAGHAEGGNDLPLLLSTTKAERVDGGYRFTGRKSFGSLTPVWDYMGMHGLDTSDPNAPKVVHAFMPRGTEGSTIVDVWDTLGMRSTQSQDTILDGVFIPDQYIPRVVSAGAAGIDLFVIGIFAWALLGFANVYYGNAQHMLDLTIASLKTKTAMALTRPMIYHPEIQHEIAELVMEMEAIEPHIDRIAHEWSTGVDKCLDLMGGFSIFKEAGVERIWRDARLGLIHPANNALSHEFVGKTALGINPDEQPRWG